jgi:hypothetical protein
MTASGSGYTNSTYVQISAPPGLSRAIISVRSMNLNLSLIPGYTYKIQTTTDGGNTWSDVESGILAPDKTLVRSFDERLAADTRQLSDSTRFINSAALDQPPVFRPFGGIVASPGPVKQSAAATAADGPALQAGQTIRVTGREGNWYRVTLPNGRNGFVPIYAVAQQVTPVEHQGASAQPIRSAAKDDADTVGDVAAGSTYRVVGRMTGWLVVDNAGRRSFVRATALRPANIDESGSEVVQATASAVASRNAFASGTDTLAAEARRVTLDT